MSTFKSNCWQTLKEVANDKNMSKNIIPNSQPLPSTLPTLNSPLEVNNSSSPCYSPCCHENMSTQTPTQIRTKSTYLKALIVLDVILWLLINLLDSHNSFRCYFVTFVIVWEHIHAFLLEGLIFICSVMWLNLILMVPFHLYSPEQNGKGHFSCH